MSPISSFIAFQPTMTVATSSESVHSVSCLSRGLALFGLHPSPSKRTPTPLSEKNLKLHTGSDSGSETSSTQSWFTVEKPQSPEQANETEKLPAPTSDSTSQLAVETYEEDLPTYTEPSTLTVSVRYKHHEIYFLVKPTTRIKIIKVSLLVRRPSPLTLQRGFANHYGSKGELRPEKLQ